MLVLSIRHEKLKQLSVKYLRKDKTLYYQVKVLMVNRITRSMSMFFRLSTLRGVCLICLTLNLIVVYHFTKHSICETSFRLNKCLIKVKTKSLKLCLSQFCDHSQLQFIALSFQIIKISP